MTNSATKAIFVDFDCVHEYFDGTEVDLIKFVLSRDRELEGRFHEALCCIPNERSELARIWYWFGDSERLLEDLSEIPESDRPNKYSLFDDLQTLRERAVEAHDADSYRNLFYPDFPKAASYWLQGGFRIIIFSTSISRDVMIPVINNAGLSDKVVTIKIPSNSDSAWIEQVSKDLEVDVQASFLITSTTHTASKIRQRYSVKTAALDRNFVHKPYDEKGRYLSIGKLTDLDPEPGDEDSDIPLTENTSLSRYIRSGS